VGHLDTIGYREALPNLVERETNLKIIIGDNSTHPVKGSGSISFHLDYGQTIHLQDVLYVLSLKKNLVSISTLEYKGFRVAFINGKVLAWQRRSNLRATFTLGVRNEGLYRVCG